MKKMVYGAEQQVLEVNEYRNITYVVINRKSHPCGYIRIPKEFYMHIGDCYDDYYFLPVHGGTTYDGDLSKHSKDILDGDKIPEGFYVGWDYAHLGDRLEYGVNSINHPGDKEWTTEEVVEECRAAIDSLIDEIWDMDDVWKEAKPDYDAFVRELMELAETKTTIDPCEIRNLHDKYILGKKPA